MSPSDRKQIYKARALWEQDKVDDAWEIIKKLMLEHPFEGDCLRLAGHIFEKANNMPVAYHFFRMVKDGDDRNATDWLNFGRLAQELWRTTEAERAYEKCLKLTAKDETHRCLLGNWAAMCCDIARYQDAERWANKALADWPDFAGARANLGFAQLGQGNWAEGWKNYHAGLGLKTRTKVQYHDEPEWDGTPGQIVAVYGEQGLGDEIVFASMLPDLIRDSRRVIVDCDLRLANLFSRSFPNARVYGTRKAKAGDGNKWRAEDRNPDASLAIGQLGEFYRTSAESFPQKPYLQADPERVLMWKALWESKRKPVIGIAWSGGIPKNGSAFRRCSLAEWKPLFDQVDAHYVSLQYKHAGSELAGFPVTEYSFATLSKDYDDTAALVASLDCVIGVPTAVIHLAGALGVPTFAMNSKINCWKYNSGNLFHPSINVPWAGSWKDTIASTVPEIRKLCESSSATTRDSRSPTTSCSPRLPDMPAGPLQSHHSSLINCPSNGAG